MWSDGYIGEEFDLLGYNAAYSVGSQRLNVPEDRTFHTHRCEISWIYQSEVTDILSQNIFLLTYI